MYVSVGGEEGGDIGGKMGGLLTLFFCANQNDVSTLEVVKQELDNAKEQIQEWKQTCSDQVTS